MVKKVKQGVAKGLPTYMCYHIDDKDTLFFEDRIVVPKGDLRKGLVPSILSHRAATSPGSSGSLPDQPAQATSRHRSNPQPTSTFPIRPCTQEPELPTEETASHLAAVCLQQLRRRALLPDHRISFPSPRSPLPFSALFLFPTLKLPPCFVLDREPKGAQLPELGLEVPSPSPGERRIQPSLASASPASDLAIPVSTSPPPLPCISPPPPLFLRALEDEGRTPASSPPRLKLARTGHLRRLLAGSHASSPPAAAVFPAILVPAAMASNTAALRRLKPPCHARVEGELEVEPLNAPIL
ncbi:lysine-rich arabinogalactan protein 19-like [Triticum urartu]|uniref:lysine-rich arabinogalactan protein 19-like n=1 Tax=Triticum urartu TaxID=4572 RepID=UPI002043923B|nr:lysine-rich arabinogalactan protein 19-like [Triticum urartu]XP_048538047.1 lysine-rich arabinogalactan protein 19-like [Triticum urartu]